MIKLSKTKRIAKIVRDKFLSIFQKLNVPDTTNRIPPVMGAGRSISSRKMPKLVIKVLKLNDRFFAVDVLSCVITISHKGYP